MNLGTNVRVTGVADGVIGADSADAVNGKQLSETNARVSSLENEKDSLKNDVTSLSSRLDTTSNQADSAQL